MNTKEIYDEIDRLVHYLAFWLRDTQGEMPRKIRVTLLFGEGDASYFSEREIIYPSEEITEEWYQQAVKKMALDEARKIIDKE